MNRNTWMVSVVWRCRSRDQRGVVVAALGVTGPLQLFPPQATAKESLPR